MNNENTDGRSPQGQTAERRRLEQGPQAPREPHPRAEEIKIQPWSTWWIILLGVVLMGLLLGLFIFGFLPRLYRIKSLDQEARDRAHSPPRVVVVAARLGPTKSDRTLPGNVLPLFDASIFARTTGYLKERLVDIGDRVKKDQLLAVIEAPDIDAQLDQAKANLAQAKANLPLTEANAQLARTTLARDLKAGPGLAVTLEQIDQDRATVSTTAAQVDVAKSTIDVNKAAVERYSVLQNFQQIRAPFPGVITVRNVDKGDLVSADNSSGSKELFHLMETDILRVWVNVPQVFAPLVKREQDAVVFRREDPARVFHGKVKRTGDALDPNTRTLLTEVHVANPDNALRPGMYLQVHFVFDRDTTPILIPSAALITRDGGPMAAVLDSDNKVRYRKLQLGRDYGAELEVTSGLKVGERVLVHPGDDLPDGTVAEPMAMPK